MCFPALHRRSGCGDICGLDGQASESDQKLTSPTVPRGEREAEAAAE
jgi:hypothetical protein